jgi:predicted MFS family arabinose efflux permease
MLTRYRAVLERPGALRFSLAAMVARLPISIDSLGIVLLVTGLSRSYGLAGALAAAYTLANGGMSVVQGRLFDRLGQSRVLPVVASIFGVAVVVLVSALESGWPDAVAFVAAAAAGAAYPPVGSCVRARWSYVLTGRPLDVQTAYALESVIDEAIFMIGPTLGTVLATTWHPWAGLGMALVTGLTGSFYLASLVDSEPPPQPQDRTAEARPGMPWVTVVPLTVVSVALGSMFAAVEVGTVAFSGEQHAKPFAGVLLALWSLGSLIAGLVSGNVQWRRPAVFRVEVGCVVLALVMLPMAFVDSMPVMGAALFVAGFAIAPTLIASMTAIEQTVPSHRLTEGIAILHTGISAGLAPGAALGGLAIDAHGASAAYVVAVVAGVVAAVSAFTVPS